MERARRLAQCLSRFLVVSSVLMGCAHLSLISLQAAGPGSESEAFETWCSYPEHNFFAGQQNQKPDLAVNLGAGSPAAITCHPTAQPHSREAALGGVGVQTPAGTSGFCQPPCLPPSASREEEGGAAAGWGQSLSTLPVSALEDHAPRHQTSDQRERDVLGSQSPCCLCL